MNFKWVLYLIFLCVVLLVLGGCPRQYYVHMKDSSDLMRPVFCVTENSIWCGSSGIQRSSFHVDELSEDGSIINSIWMIQHESGPGKINEIKYGETPEGYRVVYKAKEFKLDTFYLIGNLSVYKLFKDESSNKLEFVFMSYSDFYSMLRKKGFK